MTTHISDGSTGGEAREVPEDVGRGRVGENEHGAVIGDEYAATSTTEEDKGESSERTKPNPNGSVENEAPIEADRGEADSGAPKNAGASSPPPPIETSLPCNGQPNYQKRGVVSPHASVLGRGDDRDFHQNNTPRSCGNGRDRASGSTVNGNIGSGGVNGKVSSGEGWLSLGGWLSRNTSAGKEHGSDVGSSSGRGRSPPASAFAALADSSLVLRDEDAPLPPSPSESCSPRKRKVQHDHETEEVDRYLSLQEDGASLPSPPPISRRGKTGVQRLFGRRTKPTKKSSKESRLLDHADSASATASSHGYSLHEVRSGEGRSGAKEKKSAEERVEDRVRDECSFFYTGFDDDEEAMRRRRRGRSALDRQYTAEEEAQLGIGGYGLDSGHRDTGGAVHGSSPGGALYLPDERSRDTFLAHHERLNSGDFLSSPPCDDQEEDDHSHYSAMSGGDGDGSHQRRLPLPPDAGSPPRGSGPHRPNLATMSSLYYLTNGERGVQIRLPSDNVRLIMDPNLEPGILSVEYGAPLEKDDDDDNDDNGEVDSDGAHSGDEETALRAGCSAGKGNSDGGSKRPKGAASETLDYVLTVDDELYRRLVKEMSDSARIPCGLYHCCGESETSRVHISVAICLLGLFFIFLLVNTIIWPYG